MATTGIGLALSGGGFRAALFHFGSLLRLNELGLLPQVREVCSVSGGSIVAGQLALRWRALEFDAAGVAANLDDCVGVPLRAFCRRTIDLRALLGGWLHPFRRPSHYLERSYDRHLFRGATLQDLPLDAEGPRFTFYATSLQTGASVRFSRPYLGEYHLGRVLKPRLSLAKVVTASSAFPPFFVPVRLTLDPDAWQEERGADLYASRRLRSLMLLGDGGIYDNLGVQRIWERYETILVSDAGAPFPIIERPGALGLSQVARTRRVLDIISEQTRALRRRDVVRELVERRRCGAYWGIATRIEDYDLASRGRRPALTADSEQAAELARVRTRLNRFSAAEQGRLINWGYALTDAALRCHLIEQDAPAGRWPDAAHAL